MATAAFASVFTPRCRGWIGWAYGVPYVITLQRGGPGITYRIVSRKPLSAARSSAP